jgi:hypothetical protein
VPFIGTRGSCLEVGLYPALLLEHGEDAGNHHDHHAPSASGAGTSPPDQIDLNHDTATVALLAARAVNILR